MGEFDPNLPHDEINERQREENSYISKQLGIIEKSIGNGTTPADLGNAILALPQDALSSLNYALSSTSATLATLTDNIPNGRHPEVLDLINKMNSETDKGKIKNYGSQIAKIVR